MYVHLTVISPGDFEQLSVAFFNSDLQNNTEHLSKPSDSLTPI